MHGHSLALWRTHLHRLPTTASDIPYGTPAMARDFQRLWQETEFPAHGVAVMGGHCGGLVSIGPTVEIASERLLAL